MKIKIYVTPFWIDVPDGSPEEINDWINDQIDYHAGGELCDELVYNIGWSRPKRRRKNAAKKEPTE